MEASAWVTGASNQSQMLLNCATGNNALLIQIGITCYLKAFSLQLGTSLSKTMVV